MAESIVNSSFYFIRNCGSQFPNVILKSRHYPTQDQIMALQRLYAGPVNIFRDPNRFSDDDNDNEIVEYIKTWNDQGYMVYVTCHATACIRAFVEGCKFGIFERFEPIMEDGHEEEFRPRSLIHYNCHYPHSIYKVLYFANRNSHEPVLVQEPFGKTG
ncbi:MAG: hypothetical protein WCO30_02185 [bacterium]